MSAEISHDDVLLEKVSKEDPCFQCFKKGRFVLKLFGFNRSFCSNKCLRKYEKSHDVSAPKLAPGSKFLYTVDTGCQSGTVHDARSLRGLSKAILKLAARPAKKRYLSNEGPLPSEWR